MNVLVIGSTGQVAQSLMEKSGSHGLCVVTTPRADCDLTSPALEHVIARLIERVSPGLVVNAAAYTAVDKAETEPDLAMTVNAHGPELIARTCARAAIPLIHISTDYVFDGKQSEPYREADAVGPTGAYGRSKVEGERRIANACPRSIILRTAWVHSPFGNNFVKTMLRLAQTKPELGVVDDQHGNPTYAPHLADAILAIAHSVRQRAEGEDRWGVYHATGAGETTWRGLADEIFMQSAQRGGARPAVRPISTAQYPTPAARPANSRLDGRKLAGAFGVALPNWRQGVALCVERLLPSTRQL